MLSTCLKSNDGELKRSAVKLALNSFYRRYLHRAAVPAVREHTATGCLHSSHVHHPCKKQQQREGKIQTLRQSTSTEMSGGWKMVGEEMPRRKLINEPGIPVYAVATAKNQKSRKGKPWIRV